MPSTPPGSRAALTGATLALLCLASPGPQARAEQGGASVLEQADAAYSTRGQKGKAARAVELYREAIEADGGYEACWKGARAAHFYGYFVLPERERARRAAVLKEGAEWGKRAARIRPAGAEGHFFHAANLGSWGEVRGLASALAVVGEIRRSAERSLALDRTVACAGPLRMMGRFYFKLPAAFGGSRTRSLDFLEEAARLCPRHPQSHIFLAETLHALGRTDEARERCQWVLAHPQPGLEYRRFKRDAEALLARMR